MICNYYHRYTHKLSLETAPLSIYIESFEGEKLIVPKVVSIIILIEENVEFIRDLSDHYYAQILLSSRGKLNA